MQSIRIVSFSGLLLDDIIFIQLTDLSVNSIKVEYLNKRGGKSIEQLVFITYKVSASPLEHKCSSAGTYFVGSLKTVKSCQFNFQESFAILNTVEIMPNY